MAARKARALLDAGAHVRVVSPDVCPELLSLLGNSQGRLFLSRRPFRTEDLQGAFLAIAATDDRQVNEEVSREARARGVLVSVVDWPEVSDFIAPAVLRRGGLTVSVSTGGGSPALAVRLRDRLQEVVGEEWERALKLLAEARQTHRGAPAERWYAAIDSGLLELAREGRLEEARALIERCLAGQTGASDAANESIPGEEG